MKSEKIKSNLVLHKINIAKIINQNNIKGIIAGATDFPKSVPVGRHSPCQSGNFTCDCTFEDCQSTP